MGSEGLTGVRFIDHTADVGIRVRAPSLTMLFHRAALGMLALLRGWDDPTDEPGAFAPGAPSVPGPTPLARQKPGPEGTGVTESRTARVSVSGEDQEAVLVAWLREILFLHETGWDYVAAEFGRLDSTGLKAGVQLEPGAPVVREIKGVTHHALEVKQTGGEWTGRVIFDV